MTRKDQRERRACIYRALLGGITAREVKRIFQCSHNLIDSACRENDFPTPPRIKD